MRHIREKIKKKRELGRLGGKISQRNQENKRLERALKYGPVRSVESFFVLEIITRNPRTGRENHIELRHEIDNGNNRYNVYLNGERWRNQWSRTRFASWLFKQIESVRVDWQ